MTAACAEVCPAWTVTGETTVATLALAVERLKVRPLLGAGAEMVTVMFLVVLVTTLKGVVKVTFTDTFAERESGAKPTAVALIVAEPMLTPVTWGFADGTTAPGGMETLPVTVATFVSVLTNVTVTPPAGAGVDRLIGRLSAWPSPSVGSEPRLITLLVTVTSTLPGREAVGGRR